MNPFLSKDLDSLSDEELQSEYLAIRGQIHAGKRRHTTTKKLEIYYCYIIREIEKRKQLRLMQN
jgi:hypothetical protein